MTRTVLDDIDDEKIEARDPLYVRAPPGLFNKDTPIGTWWWRPPGRSRKARFLGMHKGKALIAVED